MLYKHINPLSYMLDRGMQMAFVLLHGRRGDMQYRGFYCLECHHLVTFKSKPNKDVKGQVLPWGWFAAQEEWKTKEEHVMACSPYIERKERDGIASPASPLAGPISPRPPAGPQVDDQPDPARIAQQQGAKPCPHFQVGFYDDEHEKTHTVCTSCGKELSWVDGRWQ